MGKGCAHEGLGEPLVVVWGCGNAAGNHGGPFIPQTAGVQLPLTHVNPKPCISCDLHAAFAGLESQHPANCIPLMQSLHSPYLPQYTHCSPCVYLSCYRPYTLMLTLHPLCTPLHTLHPL